MAIPALQAFVGQVGPVSVNDGVTPAVRLGKSSEMITTALHGRYYETTFRKYMYDAAAIGLTTTIGLTVNPFAGLMINNPTGSSVNLVINKFGYSFIVANPVGIAIGVMSGFNLAPAWGTLTAVTATNQFLSVGAGQAQCWTAATSSVVGNAQLNRIVASGLTAPITNSINTGATFVDLEGSIVVPPGGFVASYTSNACGTAGAAFSFSWEEVPVSG